MEVSNGVKNLKAIINRFSKAKVLVVGDLILDEYIRGSVDRISPEAPVPVVLVESNKHTYIPGGAANVANNLRSLGASVSLAGVVGNDKNREILFDKLKERGIDTTYIVTEKGRHTTLKTRVFARSQQVVRIDWEHTHPIERQTSDKLYDSVYKKLKEFDGIIIEDYGKGLFGRDVLLESIIHAARKLEKIITVDPKMDNFQHYRGVTAITPNRKEAENAIRYLKIRDRNNELKIYKDELLTDNDIKKCGFAILNHLDLDSILITLGENGMWLFEQGAKDEHIPTVAQEVFDVSGAGDTVIATFTLGLCCGASKLEAARIANFAAGIVVGKVGTAVITREELIERLP